MIWGTVNALQLIYSLSYADVPWNALLGTVYEWLGKVTNFDLINPFGKVPLTENDFFNWGFSDTECDGNKVCEE